MRWPWLLLLLAPALAGCSGGATETGAGPVRVAASLSVLRDLVVQVGGERVTVVGLVPPGADAHTYQPAPRDVKRLEDVRAVFLNGLGLEENLQGVIRHTIPRRAVVVELADDLETIAYEAEETGASDSRPAHDDDEHEGNPHLWLDVANARRYVERIRDTLGTVDPEGTAVYQANAARYLAELAALDAAIRAAIATIPAERRRLVTFHDAFPYFARAYGLELAGFAVRAPGREPSAREVKALGEVLRRQGVGTVFKEPQLNARLLEQAARDAGVRVDVLYSDALTAEIPSYVAMMRRNADTIVRGLQ